MAEDSEAPRRDKRDPILMIGTIVLVAAFIVVIGGYAYGELSPANEGPMKYGDSVKVDYVGSYYGWHDGYAAADYGYDVNDIVVFDTSVWSVADDDAIAKSYEFTKKNENQYTPFSVTIGSGGALTDFENSLIDAKPGDVIHISIENAYGELENANKKDLPSSASLTKPATDISFTEVMSLPVYKLTFGIPASDTVYPGTYMPIHPYGWKCIATYTSGGYVTVQHIVEDSVTYKNADESISTYVTFSPGASEFEASFTFNKLSAGGDLKLTEFIYNGAKYYAYYDEEDSTRYMKDTAEITGMTLYFTITVIGHQ